MNRERTQERPVGPALALALVLGSCAPLDPSPEPLDDAAWFEAHRAGRTERAATLLAHQDRGVLDESTLAAALGRGSAELARLRAAWQAAERRSNRGVALPEPQLILGPQAAFGPDAGPSSPWGAFGSLVFRIPLGGRIGRQEEQLEGLADLARIRFEVRTRELGLELRVAILQRRMIQRRSVLLQELIESADRAVEVSRLAARAGTSTALDVGLLELDALAARGEVFDLEQETRVVEGTLAGLLGIGTSDLEGLRFGVDALGDGGLPPKEQLIELMLSQHTGLAILRAEYELSERSLRLAVARQWPDLGIGPNFDREGGERRTVLGLQLGLQLPIFGQARRRVRDALDAREVARARYESRARTALLELEQGLRTYEAAVQRQRFYVEDVEPRALAMVADVRRAAQAGAADALRGLEAERILRRLRLESLDAQRATRESRLAVERSVGTALRANTLGVDPEAGSTDGLPPGTDPEVSRPGGAQPPEDER